MSIRSSLLAAAFTFASLGAAHPNGLRPIEGQSINLGEVSGVAYYTVEPDGFHVVTTLAQGEAGTPIRFVTALGPDTWLVSRKGKSILWAVAQTVGFGPGRSKVLDLSMGID